jgi:hypothetical protein
MTTTGKCCEFCAGIEWLDPANGITQPYCRVPLCICHLSPKNTKKEWGKCTCIGSLHAPDCGAYANLETQIAPKYEGESVAVTDKKPAPPDDLEGSSIIPPSNESEWEAGHYRLTEKMLNDFKNGRLSYSQFIDLSKQNIERLLTLQKKSERDRSALFLAEAHMGIRDAAAQEREKMVELVRGYVEENRHKIERNDRYVLDDIIDHLSKE